MKARGITSVEILTGLCALGIMAAVLVPTYKLWGTVADDANWGQIKAAKRCEADDLDSTSITYRCADGSRYRVRTGRT